jgi:hypothetical protein
MPHEFQRILLERVLLVALSTIDSSAQDGDAFIAFHPLQQLHEGMDVSCATAKPTGQKVSGQRFFTPQASP